MLGHHSRDRSHLRDIRGMRGYFCQVVTRSIAKRWNKAKRRIRGVTETNAFFYPSNTCSRRSNPPFGSRLDAIRRRLGFPGGLLVCLLS
ncbi:hypothetical protein BHE74_00017218 [Ensete ventricosum]|nr:hypothetical protein BHE74_00017218 [Ensete ventricosum]